MLHTNFSITAVEFLVSVKFLGWPSHAALSYERAGRVSGAFATGVMPRPG